MVSSGSSCVARKVGSQQEATATTRISAPAADSQPWSMAGASRSLIPAAGSAARRST
jgi:hypothetical protein